ncbi:MAG TPA: cytidylate kinase-like family protein [Candidatus Binataceae bacterium]|nr:cytidylate kinase-like family protein [Candidatus Binataceae bacterium]
MAVIAISQQIGSRGIELGRLAAARLGFRFITGEEIVAEAGRRYGVSTDQLLVFDLRTPHFWQRGKSDSHRYLAFVRAVLLRELASDQIVATGRILAHQTPGAGCALRVRVTAPFAARVRQTSADEKIDPQAAEKYVRDYDRELHERGQTLSGVDIDDPTLYDLTINTAAHPLESIAALLAEGARILDETAAPGARESLRDAAIAAQVHAALLAHPKVRDAQIAVRCNSGAVSLAGPGLVAPWDAMVVEVARGIEGVTAVEVAAEEMPIPLTE